MTDQTASASAVVAVLYPTDPGAEPAHEVDLRELAGYGLASEIDAQWTVNTSNQPGLIELLVAGSNLTHQPPNGLATYEDGILVQQIGDYHASPTWPLEVAAPPASAPTDAAPLVITLTKDGQTATRHGVPVTVPPLPPDHPALVLPVGTVITAGEGVLHVQPAEPAPVNHPGFLRQVDEDAVAFWARVREGIVALGHRLRGA